MQQPVVFHQVQRLFEIDGRVSQKPLPGVAVPHQIEFHVIKYVFNVIKPRKRYVEFLARVFRKSRAISCAEAVLVAAHLAHNVNRIVERGNLNDWQISRLQNYLDQLVTCRNDFVVLCFSECLDSLPVLDFLSHFYQPQFGQKIRCLKLASFRLLIDPALQGERIK